MHASNTFYYWMLIRNIKYCYVQVSARLFHIFERLIFVRTTRYHHKSDKTGGKGHSSTIPKRMWLLFSRLKNVWWLSNYSTPFTTSKSDGNPPKDGILWHIFRIPFTLHYPKATFTAVSPVRIRCALPYMQFKPWMDFYLITVSRSA